MTEKEFIEKALSIKEEIKILEKKYRDTIQTYIEENCPYKIGQIIEFERTRTKNTGSFLSPKYETFAVGTIRAVLSRVDIRNIYEGDKDVRFNYTFRQLKKDSTIGMNEVYPHGAEIKWTNEFYNFETKKINKI